MAPMRYMRIAHLQFSQPSVDRQIGLVCERSHTPWILRELEVIRPMTWPAANSAEAASEFLALRHHCSVPADLAI